VVFIPSHAPDSLKCFVDGLSLSNKERDDDDKDTAAGVVSADHRHLTLSSSADWVGRLYPCWLEFSLL